MKRIIIILTFIPWFLYFYSQTKSNIKIIKNNKEDNHLIKNNFLELFPVLNIVLYGILIYFSIYYHESDNIFAVRILLFAAINIYLFFNTISKKDYVLNFEDNKERLPIKYVIIALIPLIFYLIFRMHMTSYYIMMAFNMVNYLIIRLIGLPKDEK